MTKIIFWFSMFMVFYAYFGYPLCLKIIDMLKRNQREKKDEKSEVFWPSVSFIVTAYNEEKLISEKIEQTLMLDYDKDKLELLAPCVAECPQGSVDARL